ncbi:heavy-metal-associated domain-containing protein [Picrophilus oshimae]|nr:hypothetical protein [Picrophilus oshimae]
MKVTLKVYGMTCDDCVLHVKKGLEQVGKNVKVSIDGNASLEIDDSIDPYKIPSLEVFSGRYKAQVREIKDE